MTLTATSKRLGAIALLALSVLLMGFAWKPSTPAEKNRTSVVFTQVHNHITQSVPSHTPIYIQLPGDPVTWRVDKSSSTLPVKGPKLIPNPNRLPGSGSLYQFELTLSGMESATIAITPSPASSDPLFQPFQIDLTPMEEAPCWRDCIN